MTRLSAQELLSTIDRGRVELAPNARLEIPEPPEPFVVPTLIPSSINDRDPLTSEVIVIRSSAAVGKSMLAHYLASAAGQPLLDLSQVRVSTRSLSGLLGDEVKSFRDPTLALKRGEFAVVVDALDEGRLLSTEQSFEDFLETTWDLLGSERSVVDRPKLVLLGRDQAVDLVELSLGVHDTDLSTTWFTLDFFDRETASDVIRVHAQAVGGEPHAHWHGVIDAYYSCIAEALDLSEQELWVDSHGRGFAGYAPVLAAIGQILGKETVPLRIQNALEQKGATRAWDVIEQVAQSILDRERGKVAGPLAEELAPREVPPEAYDKTEQLALLTQKAHGPKLEVMSSGRVNFSSPADRSRYQDMVKTHLPDHPFLRDGELVNQVLASIVLSYAVSEDLIPSEQHQIIKRASRHPFLWRALQGIQRPAEVGKLEGKYLGYALNSLWNDSLMQEPQVKLRSYGEAKASTLYVQSANDGEWLISVSHPIHFYERLHNAEIRCNDEAIWQGHDANREMSVFEIQGNVVFSVSSLKIIAEAIRIDGKARLRSSNILQSRLQQIIPGRTCEVGLGDAFKQWPWSELDAQLEPPSSGRSPTRLEKLISQCYGSFSGAPIHVYENSELPLQGDSQFSWVGREVSRDDFQFIIKTLLKYPEVATERTTTSSDREAVKIVTFHDAWHRLPGALAASYEKEKVDDDLMDVIEALRSKFDEG